MLIKNEILNLVEQSCVFVPTTHVSSYPVLTAFQGSAPGSENLMNTPDLSLLS
jgi:hypothetical protein